MPSDRAFRLSTYLALGLACLCVGYSEWDLLPEATVLTASVIVMLVVSYRTGERFELGLSGANRLGLVIGIVALVWLGYQFVNKNSLIYTLPWPASLLPYIGTLLMVLIPAKLFRPKHVGDWWALQGMGMAAAALASSMSDDLVFGLLLGTYALIGLWSLTLFFFRRVAGHVPPIPNTIPQPLATVVSGHTDQPARRNLARSAGWLALALAVCLPLFLISPRTDGPLFQMGKGRLETGYSGEQMIDMTRTGELQVNREVAFVVTSTRADGQPKTDLNTNQRWRGRMFSKYESGRWTTEDPGQVYVEGARMLPQIIPTPENPYQPPNFGPEGYTLEYFNKRRSSDLVVADPVAWEPGRHSPVTTLVQNGPLRPWYQSTEGSFRPVMTTTHPLVSRYQQVTRTPAAPSANPLDDDLSPPFELKDDAMNSLYSTERPQGAIFSAIPTYRVVRLPRLQTWTYDLLERLANTNPAIRTALDRAEKRSTLRIQPDDYEPVARALTNHLANSGEYSYTLKLVREDKSIDPIEEFLFKTKQGHCQRYAAALTLMLRSVGIPANYILGYKGCEPDSDGVYLIREDYAHAWVEALIPRPAAPGYVRHPNAGKPPPGQPDRVWHWLSLDPTPSQDAGTEESGWFDSARLFSLDFFRNFIVGYTPERRERTVRAIEEWTTDNWWIAPAVGSVIVAAFLGRSLWRRRRLRLAAIEPDTGVPWYDAYRHVLAAHGYPTQDGRTPHEHASAVSLALAAQPATAGVAEIPLEFTQAFYLRRYANRPATDSDVTRLTAALSRLETALRVAPPTEEGA